MKSRLTWACASCVFGLLSFGTLVADTFQNQARFTKRPVTPGCIFPIVNKSLLTSFLSQILKCFCSLSILFIILNCSDSVYAQAYGNISSFTNENLLFTAAEDELKISGDAKDVFCPIMSAGRTLKMKMEIYDDDGQRIITKYTGPFLVAPGQTVDVVADVGVLTCGAPQFPANHADRDTIYVVYMYLVAIGGPQEEILDYRMSYSIKD